MRGVRLTLLSMMFLALHISAFSQILVRGKVLDSVGAPLPFAQVQLYAHEGTTPLAATQSNPNGLFTLEVADTGIYRLEVHSLGYAEYLQEVVMPGNSNFRQYSSRRATRRSAVCRWRGSAQWFARAIR